MLHLNCKTCGISYEKPEDYKILNDEHKKKWHTPNIFFKWNLTYCDKCRQEKEKESLKNLSKVIKVLSEKEIPWCK